MSFVLIAGLICEKPSDLGARMSLPDVVSREQWLAARKQLLVKEKELTRARDRRNTTLAAVSRAPYANIAPFRQRTGWTFPWSELRFHDEYRPEDGA
jgi:predicted dithiol-disulfide oxidoreductase (DUF899 family)